MLNHRFSLIILLVALVGSIGIVGSANAQTSASAVAGPQLGVAPAQPPIFVEWNPLSTPGSWKLQVDLVVDPNGGPFEKHFQSPMGATGGPILLDALQPFPQILWEDFQILPVPGTPGIPVTDWHEKIHTPGWEWVLPGDAQSDVFPPGSSLITRNGQPWPSSVMPMDPIDPSQLWVKFPPIGPNETLDVHKALLWVGTDGNRLWGDNVLDDGTVYDESFIAVWEHPTIPEPASLVLVCMGIFAGLIARRR